MISVPVKTSFLRKQANIYLQVGPKGLEFGRYSLDYHNIRNYIHVNRAWGKKRADQHIPSYAKKLVSLYNKNGEIDKIVKESSK
jgi:7-hydroxymethyl chlorophyll a reductase